MSKDGNLLSVVDEKGNAIGQETRENIHAKGLLHKEIHVWFYTPKGEIIFQHRGKNKDTFPNLLDATVGGHVEIGEDYKDTAIKEMEEETGVKAKPKNLQLVEYVRKKAYDPVTKMTNNVIRAIYAYKYSGKLSDLTVEPGKAQGFKAWPIKRLVEGLEESERKAFISAMLEKEYLELYQKIGKLK